jgi:hypothetical protein
MPSMTALARFPCDSTDRDGDIDIILSENGCPDAITTLDTHTTLRTSCDLIRSSCRAGLSSQPGYGKARTYTWGTNR